LPTVALNPGGLDRLGRRQGLASAVACATRPRRGDDAQGEAAGFGRTQGTAGRREAADQQRRPPMVKLDKDYIFDSQGGN